MAKQEKIPALNPSPPESDNDDWSDYVGITFNGPHIIGFALRGPDDPVILTILMMLPALGVSGDQPKHTWCG